MAPSISGIHHVTFVVSNLNDGIVWFERTLGARHVRRLDHHNGAGVLFGVVLELDGFPGMLELLIETDSCAVPVGYDPITFEVANDESLAAWWEHLDSVGESPSPIKRRRTGRSIEVVTPDGIVVRFFTAPPDGFDKVPFQEEHVDL